MIKQVFFLLSVAVACVACQEAPASEAAPEPYSYAYQTESHAASEQRDPSGKVTGFYTLTDPDGRERRVEYVADEAGFRAKIATNEVGTKSESPADVEINASEPTPNQYLAYQQAPQAQYQQGPAPQVQYQAARQQQVQQSAVPRVSTTSYQQQNRGQVAYFQQPQQQGANYAYGYGNNPYYSGGYYNPGYGYGYGAGAGAGARTAGYGNYESAYQTVGNYNNHLPSQYYRSVSSSSSVNPSGYSVGGVRYVTQQGVPTAGVRYPSGVSYSGFPAGGSSSSSISSSTRTVSGSSNSGGSSNYLVLQKRDTTGNI